MANMTSGSDESQGQRSAPEQGGIASKLSHGASEVADQAIERVQSTRDRLEEQLAQRRSQLSERFRDVSEVLSSAGRKLGDDDLIADGLHYVGGKIERVASYIESADPTRLAEDVRYAVRARPTWFFGGAFVLGLALGRFAKSSAEVLVDEENDEGTERRARLQRTTGSTQRATGIAPRGAGAPVTGNTMHGMGTPQTGTRESLSGRPGPASTPSSTTGAGESTTGGARPPVPSVRQPGARQP